VSEVKLTMLSIWGKQLSKRLNSIIKTTTTTAATTIQTKREQSKKINERGESVFFSLKEEEKKSLLEMINPLMNEPEPFELWPLPNDYTQILQVSTFSNSNKHNILFLLNLCF
jgi:hypothetical protein